MGVFIIFTLIAVPLFVLGLVLRFTGKGLMLVAGYNTMPSEQRDAVDKKGLSKAVGNLLLRISPEFALSGLCFWQDWLWAGLVFIAIFILDTSVSALIINKRFPDKPLSNIPDGSGKWIAIIVVVIGVASIALMGTIFILGEREPEVTISGGHLEIKAMFAPSTSISDITSVTLLEQSMNDLGPGRRTNGYGGVGSTLKGHFNSPELGGNILLYVDAASSPTIYITRARGEDIYLSYSDSSKTKEVYQTLLGLAPPTDS